MKIQGDSFPSILQGKEFLLTFPLYSKHLDKKKKLWGQLWFSINKIKSGASCGMMSWNMRKDDIFCGKVFKGILSVYKDYCGKVYICNDGGVADE